MDIQVWASQSITQLAGILQVGYAFGAGMVSAVNPCGFAMLPVYLSLYLGAEHDRFEKQSWIMRLARAVGVAGVVSAGFAALFGTLGILVSAGGSFLLGVLPWLSILIGVGLVGLGIWMLLGKHVALPGLLSLTSRIGDPRNISIKGFFLFGLAFGATSLSCTLPIFLVVVGGSLASADFATGLLQFLWYILGMASVLLTLTISMAFIKGGAVVTAMRRIIPYVQTISAVLLIAAGAYIIFYWSTSGLLMQ